MNGTKWGPDRPAFPLLQAEKVLSLPLQLRFDSDYRYRLAGTERVGDYDCYVVRFDPVREGQSLYRGTVWIDADVCARQGAGGADGAVGAGRLERGDPDATRRSSIGNRPVFLFTGLTARQIMLIAGRNLLVEKSVAFSDFRVNPEDFEGSRAEARRSDRIMYRETDRGLRYYVKEGDNRVVSDRSTQSARAMAMGVTLDPSYAFPLPIFGINYLDFEFGARTRSWRSCSPACSRPATSSGRRSAHAFRRAASTSSRSPCRRAIGSTTPRASRSRSAC